MHDSRKHTTWFITGLKNERAGSIPEQDARIAVLPIYEAGKGFGSNDQRIFDGAATNSLCGHIGRKDKTGASGEQVKSAGLARADLILNQASCSRENIFRRRRGTDD